MKNKKILVGVTGGVAAYKICSLVNYFIKEGAEVKVIMTAAATKFVTPLTFASLTNNQVYVDMFSEVKSEIEHVSLAQWADVFVLAPATANTIGKISLGLADNLLTTVVMALPAKTKVIIVPAMNTEMWLNPIVQNNVSVLKKQGKYKFIDPRAGTLACRLDGQGKIASNEDIFEFVKNNLK
jgi:phosphopantothenoylcysteine decarboxylase / phosphopantothenate---cysteine ligase